MSNHNDKNELNSGKLLTSSVEDNPEPSFKYPNGYFKDKQCKSCGEVFTPTNPCNVYCSDICKKNNAYYLRNYGITNVQYKALKRSQGDICAICGDEGFLIGKKGHHERLVVDHNHESGKVRGLLCHNCNRALGLFNDNIAILEAAIKYVEEDGEGATTILKRSTLK